MIAKRPIANAAWRGADDRPGFYGGYVRPYVDRLKQMKLNPADLGIGGDPNDAWLELALRFTLSHPGVHTAIIGTTNPANARANLAAAEKGPLPDDVVAKVRSAFRSADPTGQWPGLS